MPTSTYAEPEVLMDYRNELLMEEANWGILPAEDLYGTPRAGVVPVGPCVNGQCPPQAVCLSGLCWETVI